VSEEEVSEEEVWLGLRSLVLMVFVISRRVAHSCSRHVLCQPPTWTLPGNSLPALRARPHQPGPRARPVPDTAPRLRVPNSPATPPGETTCFVDLWLTALVCSRRS
jgi:hypothetical protein